MATFISTTIEGDQAIQGFLQDMIRKFLDKRCLARDPIQVYGAARGHDGGNGAVDGVEAAIGKGQVAREQQESRGGGGRVAQFLMQMAATSTPKILERRPAVDQLRGHIAEEEAGHAGTKPDAHQLGAWRKVGRLLSGHGADDAQAAFRPENYVHAAVRQYGVGGDPGYRVPAPEALGERREGARGELLVV